MISSKGSESQSTMSGTLNVMSPPKSLPPICRARLRVTTWVVSGVRGRAAVSSALYVKAGCAETTQSEFRALRGKRSKAVWRSFKRLTVCLGRAAIVAASHAALSGLVKRKNGLSKSPKATKPMPLFIFPQNGCSPWLVTIESSGWSA